MVQMARVQGLQQVRTDSTQRRRDSEMVAVIRVEIVLSGVG
jgi:hypothetical protein